MVDSFKRVVRDGFLPFVNRRGASNKLHAPSVAGINLNWYKHSGCGRLAKINNKIVCVCVRADGY